MSGASTNRDGGAPSARWSTLRNAFLSAVAASKTAEGGGGADTTAGTPAINININRSSRCTNSSSGGGTGIADQEKRFEGFQLFPRQEEESDGELGGGVILATYQLPNGSQVVTQEASSRRGRGGRPTVTLQQLFAHRVHGVDNTGNVRVWPAEQVLLHTLLSGPLVSSLEGSRVLELGAGKTGLAGLGVAACSGATDVVITDGNPDALRNLEACVELNAKKGVFGSTKVSARRLVWDSLDRDGSTGALCSSHPGGFDLVIASDCLFFKDFHGDLKRTIETLLAPNGRAILVQPQRGGTADLFMRRINSSAKDPSSKSVSDRPGGSADASKGSSSNSSSSSSGGGKGGGSGGGTGNSGNSDNSGGRSDIGCGGGGGGCSGSDGTGTDGVGGGDGGSGVARGGCSESKNVAVKRSSSGSVVVESGGGREGCNLEARLLERYDERVWNMHREYLASSRRGDGGGVPVVAYNPDGQQPLLMELRKAFGGSIGGEGGGSGGAAVAGGSVTEVAELETSVGRWWTPWQTSGSGFLSEVDGSGSSGSGGLRPEAPLSVPPPPPETPLSCTGSSSDPIGATQHVEDEGGGGQPERHEWPAADPDRNTPSERSERPEWPERPDRRMEAVYERLAERLRVTVRERRSRSEATRTASSGGGGGGGGGGGDGGGGDVVGEGKGEQLWVAVAGAPGSGKTTLAAEVCRLVQAEFPAVCVPMDGYHLYRRELDAMPNAEEARRRRGAHWTFDGARFLREVGEARRRGRGSFPGFDHAVGDPVENVWTVKPSHAVVIVEGNYLLLKGVKPWDGASALFDEAWAIRCPSDVCAERVRKRHVETGIEEGEARARVEGNDLPNAVLVEERCPWHEVDVVVDSV